MDTQNIKFFHQTPVQIRFNDIDILGHVNNTTIQEFFDLGRVNYFRSAFKKSIDWTNFSAIIASNKTDFIAPVFLDDSICIYTKMLHIGNKSMRLIQHLIDDKNQVRATCDSVMVGFDKDTQQSIVIPNDWRKIFGTIEVDISFNDL